MTRLSSVVRFALLASLVVLATFAEVLAAFLPQPAGAQTLPVSDSVLATIVTEGDSLSLLVLWRGTPGWFLKGASHGASAGARNGVVSASLLFGGQTLDLTFDRPRQQLSIQGKSQPISGDSNVVLVDDTDSASGPRVVKMLAMPAAARDVDPKVSLAPFFKRSDQMAAFLQCGTSEGTAQSKYFARIVCNDLRGK